MPISRETFRHFPSGQNLVASFNRKPQCRTIEASNGFPILNLLHRKADNDFRGIEVDKHKGKVVVKYVTDYNKHIKSEYEIFSLSEFNNTIKTIKQNV